MDTVETNNEVDDPPPSRSGSETNETPWRKFLRRQAKRRHKYKERKDAKSHVFVEAVQGQE